MRSHELIVHYLQDNWFSSVDSQLACSNEILPIATEAAELSRMKLREDLLKLSSVSTEGVKLLVRLAFSLVLRVLVLGHADMACV